MNKREEFEKKYGPALYVEDVQCFKIGNKFYEFVEPMESQSFEKDYFFGGEICRGDVVGAKFIWPKKKYEKSSAVILREVIPVLTGNGLGVKVSKNLTIKTSKGPFGSYTCKDDEQVVDICDDGFVIVEEEFGDKISLKDMYYGDTFIREIKPHSIQYNAEKMYFAVCKGFLSDGRADTQKITLDQVLEEFEKRMDLNRQMYMKYGITADQAKNISQIYNYRQNEKERE